MELLAVIVYGALIGLGLYLAMFPRRRYTHE